MCNKRHYSVMVNDPDTKVSVTPLSCDDGVTVCRIHVVFPQSIVPSPVTVCWEEDMVNILSVWHPTGGRHRAIHQWFCPTHNFSNFCSGAPILCTIGEKGFNTQTVSASDCCHPITMQFFVKDLEQQDKVEYRVSFFTGTCRPMKEYIADIRIDCRKIPYYDSILSVSEWWASYGYTFPSCPAAAEDPLYSSWYNFHQAPDGERLLADLSIASKLGFRTVILDDGWQFAGPSSGSYSQCGEWQVSPDKFADFKTFTDQVHRLGMKLMVWFSVPLCAKQLLNILFGVPQISVILADSTDEQKQLLKHYLEYWTEHRDVLLHGTFIPLHPELNYTSVSAESDQKRITVLYTDLPYTWDGKNSDVFLNGNTDGLILENDTILDANVQWFDCLGNQLGTMTAKAGSLVRVSVPQTGMVRICMADHNGK